MTELKPCPFCGGCDGDPTAYASNQNGWYVYCKCGARVGYFKTAEFAIAAWNTRAERTCRNISEKNWWAFECSECGEMIEQGVPEYCPSCGARVKN